MWAAQKGFSGRVRLAVLAVISSRSNLLKTSIRRKKSERKSTTYNNCTHQQPVNVFCLASKLFICFGFSDLALLLFWKTCSYEYNPAIREVQRASFFARTLIIDTDACAHYYGLVDVRISLGRFFDKFLEPN